MYLVRQVHSMCAQPVKFVMIGGELNPHPNQNKNNPECCSLAKNLLKTCEQLSTFWHN